MDAQESLMNKKIYSRIIEIRTEQPFFNLAWIVNNICTNHCPYCPDILHRGQNHYYTWEQAEQFADEMLKLHPKMRVTFSGGEPTVSPWIKPLINKFLDHGQQVAITTNGIRSGNYWDDCRPTHLRISYHPHANNNQGFVTRAVDSWARIPDTVVRIMMTPDRWDECLAVYRELESTGIGLEVVRILDWGAKTYEYAHKQNEFFERTKPRTMYANSNLELVNLAKTQVWTDLSQFPMPMPPHWPVLLANTETNRFQGWSCDIGIEELFLQFDGKIRKGNCEQDGWFADIRDPATWIWPTKSTVCQQTECQCISDIRVSKRKFGDIPVDKSVATRGSDEK